MECPTPGPPPTGCELIFSEALKSPLSKETYPSGFGLGKVQLWPSRWNLSDTLRGGTLHITIDSPEPPGAGVTPTWRGEPSMDSESPGNTPDTKLDHFRQTRVTPEVSKVHGLLGNGCQGHLQPGCSTSGPCWIWL